MFAFDGSVRSVKREDLRPGVVLRMVHSDGTSAAFSDCVIVRVESDMIHLVRPMGWADGTVNAERFPALTSSVLEGGGSHDYFKTVLLSTGEPYTLG
jgi:hypothetical protein